MNRLQMYRLLRRNAKLSEKRNPALEQNMVAKVLMYIGAGLLVAYMIVIGSLLGRVAAEDDEPGLLLLVLPFFLIFDFLGRLSMQQTPMVFVKPFLIQPIKAQWVVESYLLSMVISSYSIMWLSLFLPYAYVSILAGCSFWAVMGVVVGCEIMVMFNGQWYLLVRTLVRRSLLWWLLPAALYAVFLLPIIFNDKIGMDWVQDIYDCVIDNAPILWLIALILLILLIAMFVLNCRLQMRFIYEELSRAEKKAKAMKSVWQFSFLERFGQAGEYLKLELKSIFRNKAIRSRVIMSLGLVVMLSGLISFTDVYDGKVLLNFWCYYCFAIYGMTTLVKIMGPEGNYIDLLLTQRENILMLLRAKYYFHVAILLVPLLIMLPAVISGKFTILMMLAYLLLTSGVGYFIMFQLAVYNKQTLPLNEKITGKNNVESGFQLLIEMLGMFLPLLLVGLMLALFSEQTAYLLMAALGLVVTLAHPLWLRHIYTRMMRRKYANLEGFHATR